MASAQVRMGAMGCTEASTTDCRSGLVETSAARHFPSAYYCHQAPQHVATNRSHLHNPPVSIPLGWEPSLVIQSHIFKTSATPVTRHAGMSRLHLGCPVRKKSFGRHRRLMLRVTQHGGLLPSNRVARRQLPCNDEITKLTLVLDDGRLRVSAAKVSTSVVQSMPSRLNISYDEAMVLLTKTKDPRLAIERQTSYVGSEHKFSSRGKDLGSLQSRKNTTDTDFAREDNLPCDLHGRKSAKVMGMQLCLRVKNALRSLAKCWKPTGRDPKVSPSRRLD
nr:hypothetical protein CFP56_01155 [Quercus suber]